MGEEEKKPEETKKLAEEGKKLEETPKAAEAAPPPPPPQEIVLRVYMHCEGCATKVRRCLKGFEGVEEVITDCKSSKVVVKGEKADPLKVLGRVQRKSSHRQVELISPIPTKPPTPDQDPKQKELVKAVEDKKEEEPPVITVVLGVFMHCEACAQEIKKRIQKMKGVESVEPDLKGSQVTVKGAIEPEKLTDFVHKRTGKHAVIIKVEPEKKAAEEKGKEEKKAATEEKGKEEKKKAGKEEKTTAESGGGDGGEPPAKAAEEAAVAVAEEPKMELKKNEFYYYHHPQNNYQVYPQRFVQDMYAYPPQMFSDENPNACSVM